MAEPMDAEILYQDQQLLFCVKPQGLISEEGGLPDRLREKLGGEIFCVHRLDKAAGGVMVYARSQKAAAALSRLVSARELEKEYLAVVSGRPEEPAGTMEDLLYRDAGKNKSYVVKRERRGVKAARLRYCLLAEKDGLSLVRIRLETGRSHQIRVQFASRGMPLVGDAKYGSPYRDSTLALWERRLALCHPFTGEALGFEAPPPQVWPWTMFTPTKPENDI